MPQIQTKLTPIHAFPDGDAKTLLSKLTLTLDMTVPVVAKEGTIGDWACYIGWPKRVESKPQYVNDCQNDWYFDRLTDAEGIVKYGDKLPENTARVLFPEPEWANRKYRP